MVGTNEGREVRICCDFMKSVLGQTNEYYSIQESKDGLELHYELLNREMDSLDVPWNYCGNCGEKVDYIIKSRDELRMKIADIINGTVGLKMSDLSDESKAYILERAEKILQEAEKFNG